MRITLGTAAWASPRNPVHVHEAAQHDRLASLARSCLASAALALVLLAPTAASAEITTDTVRLKAEQACYDDVNKLCADAIPDEDRIKACMKVHRAELSPKCRAIFDSNMK